MLIPVIQYVRPHGERREGHLEVSDDEQVAAKLEQLTEFGIEVTAEAIPGGQVVICLDEGTFDYKTQIVPNDEELPNRVADLVREFDADDFRRYREAQG